MVLQPAPPPGQINLSRGNIAERSYRDRRDSDKPGIEAASQVWRYALITTRQMMLLVAVVAAMLGSPQLIERAHQYFRSRAMIPYLMADLCGNESFLFSERAATCRSLAFKHTSWDQDGEYLETLRLCPHQLQEAEHGSWAEQAEGWERAANHARRASVRHRRTAGLYDLWGCWPAVAPLSLIAIPVVSWSLIGRPGRSRNGESTRRWSRIALILIMLGLLMWMFQDEAYKSLFLSVRE